MDDKRPGEPYRLAALAGRVSLPELVDRTGHHRTTILAHIEAGKLRGRLMAFAGHRIWTFSKTESDRYCRQAVRILEEGKHAGGNQPVPTPPGYMTVADLAQRRGCGEKPIRRAIARGDLPVMVGKLTTYFIPAEAGVTFVGPMRNGREVLRTRSSVVFYLADRMGYGSSEIAGIADVAQGTAYRWLRGNAPSVAATGKLLAHLRGKTAVAIGPELMAISKGHRAEYMRDYMAGRRSVMTPGEDWDQKQSQADYRARNRERRRIQEAERYEKNRTNILAGRRQRRALEKARNDR